jgi:hypothetical protein
MKNQWPYLLVVFLIASCGREFSSPPPAPQIESLTPAAGFMGDLVTVRGVNFARNAEDNLVFFGTESARILSGSESELVVEVPALEAGESVHVKVSTTLGQGTSPDPFVCKGPGHPVAERLDHKIEIEWAPLAVTPVLSQDDLDSDPCVVVASYTGRTVSLLGTRSGAHVDFGVGQTPISVALTTYQGDYLAYLTTVEVTPGEDTLVDTRLDVISIADTPGICAGSIRRTAVARRRAFPALPDLVLLQEHGRRGRVPVDGRGGQRHVPPGTAVAERRLGSVGGGPGAGRQRLHRAG